MAPPSVLTTANTRRSYASAWHSFEEWTRGAVARYYQESTG